MVEEVKKELDKVTTDLKNQIEDYKKSLKDLEKKGTEADAQLKELSGKIVESEEKRVELQDQVDKLEAKSKRGGGLDKPETFSDRLEKAFTEKKESLLKLKGGDKSAAFNMGVKAAGTMTISGNYSGGVVGLTQWDPTLARPARRTPRLRQIMQSRPVSNMYVAWAEMANRDGGATAVAEGVKKPQKDFDLVEASKKVEKIAEWIKVSKEMLDDIPYIVSEINQELVEDVNLEFDRQLFTGTGTSPELKGIYNYATVLSVAGTPFATAGGGVVSPDREEAIMVAAAIIQVTSFYNPNYVLVHPYDYTLMRMRRNTQGDSVTLSYVNGDGNLMIGDVMVVPDVQVPVGEFLIGDFTKAIVGIREEVNIQVGYENDDFTKNLITILGELRAVHYVKATHVGAFKRGVFATVIAAITPA